MRKYIRWLMLLLPLAVIVLAARPDSVQMRFMGDPSLGKEVYVYSSAFSMLPVGYAIWGPGIGAVSAVVSAILMVINGFRPRKGLCTGIFWLAIVGVLAEASLLLFGMMNGFAWCFLLIYLLQGTIAWYLRK